MLESYPRSPIRWLWSDAYWNNLLRTVEDGEGYDLFQPALHRPLGDDAEKTHAAQFATLEDVLVDTAQRDNPASAPWLEKSTRPRGPSSRRNELRLREG